MFKMFKREDGDKQMRYRTDEGYRSYLLYKEWYQDERNRYLIDSTMFHAKFKNTPYQAVSEELFDRVFYIYGDLKHISKDKLVNTIEDLGGRVVVDEEYVEDIDCCICGMDSADICNSDDKSYAFLFKLAERGVELMYENEFIKKYIKKK